MSTKCQQGDDIVTTVQDYARLYNVSARTVYRWIDEGKVRAQKHLGKLVIIDDNETDFDDIVTNASKYHDNPQELIQKLYDEIEYLRQELTQANQTITEAQQRYDDAQQRHDTIVMQLSKQLEKQTFLLEDMRNRSVWQRFKSALGFGQRASPEQVSR